MFTKQNTREYGHLSGHQLFLHLLPGVEGPVFRPILHVAAVVREPSLSLQVLVDVPVVLGETPLLRNVDLLAAGELELSTTQRLDHLRLVTVTRADAHDRLADVNTGHRALRFAEGASHSGLKPEVIFWRLHFMLVVSNRIIPISTGTRQHLVDSNHVERMQSHPDVELILTAVLHQILVGADTARFESFGAELLVLIGDEVNAKREVIDTGLLFAKIEDTDLGVRYTTTESGLGVRLVLTVTVAEMIRCWN